MGNMITAAAQQASNSSSSFLLDNRTGLAFAYSMRQLTSISPTLASFYRSGDSASRTATQADILNGDLTAWAIAGGGSQKVSFLELADQSGAFLPMLKPTTDSPYVIDNGVMMLENGKPTMKFNGSEYLTAGVGNSLDYSNNFLTIFAVVNNDAGTLIRFISDHITGTQGYFSFRLAGVCQANDGAGYKSLAPSISSGQQKIVRFTLNGTTGQLKVHVNGVLIFSEAFAGWGGEIGSSGTAGLAIGSAANVLSTAFNGTMQEVFGFTANASNEAVEYELDMKNYYQINY